MKRREESKPLVVVWCFAFEGRRQLDGKLDEEKRENLVCECLSIGVRSRESAKWALPALGANPKKLRSGTR